jgi:hypothetical protein
VLQEACHLRTGFGGALERGTAIVNGFIQGGDPSGSVLNLSQCSPAAPEPPHGNFARQWLCGIRSEIALGALLLFPNILHVDVMYLHCPSQMLTPGALLLSGFVGGARDRLPFKNSDAKGVCLRVELRLRRNEFFDSACDEFDNWGPDMF